MLSSTHYRILGDSTVPVLPTEVVRFEVPMPSWVMRVRAAAIRNVTISSIEKQFDLRDWLQALQWLVPHRHATMKEILRWPYMDQESSQDSTLNSILNSVLNISLNSPIR